MISRCRFIM